MKDFCTLLMLLLRRRRPARRRRACGGDDDEESGDAQRRHRDRRGWRRLSGRIQADGSSTVGPFTTAAAERFQEENSGVR